MAMSSPVRYRGGLGSIRSDGGAALPQLGCHPMHVTLKRTGTGSAAAHWAGGSLVVNPYFELAGKSEQDQSTVWHRRGERV